MGRASHPLHQACFLCFGSHAVCVTSDKTHLAHRKYTISSAAPHDNYKRRPLCISIARPCFCFRRAPLPLLLCSDPKAQGNHNFAPHQFHQPLLPARVYLSLGRRCPACHKGRRKESPPVRERKKFSQTRRKKSTCRASLIN